MKPVYVVGTADTKGEELRYVRDRVADLGVPTVTVDIGIRSAGTGWDVRPDEVMAFHPEGGSALDTEDRGAGVAAMAVALSAFVAARAEEIGGIIGIGGSGGTSIIAPAMQVLAVGVPKVMVSTMASGDIGPYVGPADIAMMYSVTDVSGLNRISLVVLGNAAHAVAGMVANPVVVPEQTLPAVGLTMFGVTTPLVTSLAEALAAQWDPLVFHATGTGGRSMEALVRSGLITAVIDTTTTEIADEIGGGVLSAGPGRLDAIIESRVPYVGSVGACDMINFGPRSTVPTAHAGRLLYEHNPTVTLMRTTAVENRRIAEFVAAKLNRCDGPVRFLLPTRGVSMLDADGMPFHDPEADAVLFDTIESLVQPGPDRRVIRVDAHINDPEFRDAVLAAFRDVTAY